MEQPTATDRSRPIYAPRRTTDTPCRRRRIARRSKGGAERRRRAMTLPRFYERPDWRICGSSEARTVRGWRRTGDLLTLASQKFPGQTARSAQHHPEVGVFERRDRRGLLVHSAAPVASLCVLEVVNRMPLRLHLRHHLPRVRGVHAVVARVRPEEGRRVFRVLL